MMDSAPKLLLRGEVAELLRCSTRTVSRMTEQGVLHPIRLTRNGDFRYRENEVMGMILGKEATAKQHKSHLTAIHSKG